MLERARLRSKSLIELVNDLLQFARLESKRAERKKELLDMKEVIESNVELLKNQGDSKDVQFQVDIPDKLPFIEADRAEMDQLMTNLISNAMKYNVKNGKVIVSARPEAHFLHISVADTGIGIEEQCLPCIFDEFYRVRGPKTRYTTGTGLSRSSASPASLMSSTGCGARRPGIPQAQASGFRSSRGSWNHISAG